MECLWATLVSFTTSRIIATYFKVGWLEGLKGREFLTADVNYWIARFFTYANLMARGTRSFLSMIRWYRIPDTRRKETEPIC